MTSITKITNNTNTKYFDIINNTPLDIIKHVIFPSLDYESRIQLNKCLSPRDRISTKLAKDAIDAHERFVCYHNLYILFIRLDKPSNSYTLEGMRTEKYRFLIKIFSLFKKPNYLNFISAELKFRNTLLSKISEFSTDIQKNDGVDISLKERVGRLLKAVKSKVESVGSTVKIPIRAILV